MFTQQFAFGRDVLPSVVGDLVVGVARFCCCQSFGGHSFCLIFGDLDSNVIVLDAFVGGHTFGE